MQVGAAGQLLPAVDVGVLVESEGGLQLLQLFVAEGGAVAAAGGGQVGPAPPGRPILEGGPVQGPPPGTPSHICFQEQKQRELRFLTPEKGRIRAAPGHPRGAGPGPHATAPPPVGNDTRD